MLQKRNGLLMIILLATACLCGCTEPGPIADPVSPKPSTAPAISEAATPTPDTTLPDATPGAEATSTPTPEPTATSTPTPTPTATPTPPRRPLPEA